MITERRRFIAKAGGVVAAAAAAAIVDAPSVIAHPKVRWRMSTIWPPALDHAAAAVQVYGLTGYHAKNAIALERLKTEFKGKVEILPLPVPVLRDLKKLSAQVVRVESEKTPMARKVHACFTKFQALVGPWDHVAEGAYHPFVAV